MILTQTLFVACETSTHFDQWPCLQRSAINRSSLWALSVCVSVRSGEGCCRCSDLAQSRWCNCVNSRSHRCRLDVSVTLHSHRYETESPCTGFCQHEFTFCIPIAAVTIIRGVLYMSMSYREIRAVFVYSSSFHIMKIAKANARMFWHNYLRHYYGARNLLFT